MAEAKKAESTEGEVAPPKKKGKLLIIIVAAVVALTLIGGGAFFMLKKNTAQGDEEEGDEDTPVAEQKAKKSKKDHGAPPVFVKLDAFTVKLQSETQDAYLQAVPELRVLDAQLGETIKQYTPEIRHKMLLLLSGKTASELGTPEGVQKLSNEMRVAINAIIEPPAPRKKSAKAPEEASDQAGPDDPVQAVLFTSFIVQ